MEFISQLEETDNQLSKLVSKIDSCSYGEEMQKNKVKKRYGEGGVKGVENNFKYEKPTLRR